MSNQNDYRLVDYLDNRLTEEEARELELLIETDPTTREQWQYLQVAVQAVEYTALQEQVAQVKEQYKASRNNNDGVVRPFRRRRISSLVASIAAVFVVVALVGVKYVTTNADDLYKQGYREYTLNTSRSGTAIDEMELAYRNANWQQVIDAFNKKVEKDNKAWFLSAMAHMTLKQFEVAAGQLEQVLMQNARTGDDYFQDEAEYYLALNLLALNSNQEAISLIEKIKADTKHLYHEQAGRISSIDLKIVSFKSGK